MRKLREVLRLKHERGLSHRAIAQACAIGLGTVTLYLRRTAQSGSAGRCRPTSTMRGSRPGCFAARRRRPTEPDPTARTSTASSSVTGSRCSCSGRSTCRSIPQATATPSSARSTGSGRGGCGRRCGRCTAPARRPSSTSRASGRRWSTGARVSCGLSSCSSPRSAPAASPTPRRPRPSSWRTGSPPTSTWSSTAGAPPRCGSPTSSRAPSPAPCRYEPDVNRTYEDLAAHYGAVVIPARPRKPRDKALVETSVLVAQRWILARLRRPDLLRARSVEPGDPRPARRAQRPPAEEAGRQPPRPLRAARPPGATAAADRALRPGPLEALSREHRLPRRARAARLQRAVSTGSRAGRGPLHDEHGRGLPSRQARGLAPAAL